tara:strand:- start:1882 stop:3054 length:1173 start_codon:yes stop_codon:yes gene_type:complete
LLKKNNLIINLSIFVLVFYICIIITDWVLKKYNFRHLSEASKIKVEMLDINMTKKIEAFKEGIKFTLYPINSEKLNNDLKNKYSILPISSLINQNSYLCDEGYGLIKYKTDKYGFRNNNEIYEKDIDLMLIGDSFIHGSCVDDKYTISNILSKDSNVINLGIGSSNPTHYQIIIKNFLEVIKPKKIIVFIYSNDYEYNKNSTYEKMIVNNRNILKKDINNNFVFSKEYLKNLNLISDFYEKNITVAEKYYDKQKELTKFWTEKINTVIYHLKLTEIKKTISTIYKINQKLIPKNTKRLINFVEKNCTNEINCEYFFVYIPASDYWDYDYRGKIYGNNVIDYLKKKDIKFIDLTNSLNLIEDYAPKGIHFSIQGNKKVSKIINNFLINLDK